jgi:hypothetical protein
MQIGLRAALSSARPQHACKGLAIHYSSSVETSGEILRVSEPIWHVCQMAEVFATAGKVPHHDPPAYPIRQRATAWLRSFQVWQFGSAAHKAGLQDALCSVLVRRYQQHLHASATHAVSGPSAGAATAGWGARVGRVSETSTLAMTRRAPGGITTVELLLP